MQALNEASGFNSAQPTSSQFAQVFERELGIEDSVDLRNACIPRLNDCMCPEDIVKLHHKLVRFDCMIQDQYEEEYFISYL